MKNLAAIVCPIRRSAQFNQDRKDFFKYEDGISYAGKHLIIDLWDASNLDDAKLIEAVLKKCVRISGATLLHIHSHQFEPNGGISAVAVLAESHISIHSWPERGYAAMDIFMCGAARPEKCLKVLKDSFGPNCRLVLSEQKRGVGVNDELN